MSKFCENCGAEMDDNQTVCPSCGNGADSTQNTEVDPIQNAEADPIQNTVEEPATDTTTSNSSPAKSIDTKNIAIIGGVIAGIAILIAIIFSIFGKGYLKPINNYFKGIQKNNIDTYTKAFPEFYDLGDDADEHLEDLFDDYEDNYGEKLKISYKVKAKEKIDKEDLENVQEYIEKVHKEEVKVTAGYELKLGVTIKGKKKEKTNTDKYYVYKIDGKWSYLNVSPKTAKSYIK